MIRILPLFIMLLFFSCSRLNKFGQYDLPNGLDGAISSSSRFEEHRDRDKYQHPKQTLQFFGIRPSMTVVEISPGPGYFTEILAPLLAKEGQLFLAVPRLPPNPSPVMRENEIKLREILLRHQEVQAKTKLMAFEPIDKKRGKTAFADLVLSFNSVHNWVAKKEARASFKFIYEVLRPGGVLGLVQHRIRERKKRVPKSGYMYESEVIALAKAEGLHLIKKSEANANPKDTADYPEGVWVLPPTYRPGAKGRYKYKDIGESDRMTLKFVKR